MKNRIVIQEAVLNTNSNYIENIKEEMREELLKYIALINLDDMITTDERANCNFLKIDCRFF